MNRLLVAPWHGLVSEELVHLANGETRQFIQPPLANAAPYGPGDTHKISVPDIAPLTAEEVAAAPAGGFYRTGLALITGGTLYGVAGMSWIYQDLEGSKWAVQIEHMVIGASASTFQLNFSRFGEFGQAAEVHTRHLEIDKGQATPAERLLAFADLGFANNCNLRLIAVSDSGRTAVLALCAFNVASTEAWQKTIDVRPRPYLYLQLSLTGTGPLILAELSTLYASESILTRTVTAELTTYRQAGTSPRVESDRQPIVDEAGTRVGWRVTYDYASDVPIYSVGPFEGGWVGPGDETIEWRWLGQMAFVGETPTASYLQVTHDLSVFGASFTVDTLQPMIDDEFDNGSVLHVQEGIQQVMGRCNSGGTTRAAWLDGEGAVLWSEALSFSTQNTSLNGVVFTQQTLGGVSSSSLLGDLTQLGGGRGGGAFGGAPDSRMPTFTAYCGATKRLRFVLYSNNLLAATAQDDNDAATFTGVFTPDGYAVYAAPFPLADQRHFGSFNPITAEFVVGSTERVNWA